MVDKPYGDLSSCLYVGVLDNDKAFSFNRSEMTILQTVPGFKLHGY